MPGLGELGSSNPTHSPGHPLNAGMDRIFKPVGKQTAQIGDLKSGKRRSSDGNRKPDLLFFCAVCIKRKNKIQCFIVTILCDRALRKRNSDLLNIFEGKK